MSPAGMGRLFWKFFLAFWLAQLAAGIGVGTAVWLHRRDLPPAGLAAGPREAFELDTGVTALRQGGIDVLRALLDTWRQAPGPALHAVDPQDRELLGRPVAPELLAVARRLADGGDPRAAARRVMAPDGRTWLLLVPAGTGPRPAGALPEARRPPPPGPLGVPPQPWWPIVAGLLASLAFSFWLARYLAKPIRHLRRAFAAAAAGDLRFRAAPGMGRRRDELADLGREFDGMADQLRALIEAQRRLLHDVSHELRSPLARLQVAVGLARQAPADLEHSLERIERETERLDGLVGELLTLSRLEAGTSGEPLQPLDLMELVAAIADDADFEARAGGRAVRFQGDGEATLAVRPELIRRAVENIVRNAVRYTRPGTAVAVSVTREFTPSRLSIRVDDQGPGVPPEALEHIFDPFWRAPGQDGQDGFGLGLAIARRAVAAHGGTLRAENRPEGGLRMRLELPWEGPPA